MDILGNIFDFGGAETQDTPMQTPEEQGGFLDWILSPEIGKIPAGTAEKIKASAQDVFLRKSLSDALEGPELGGFDFLEYDAPEKGWFGGISLTDAGKKWLLIGGAVAVGLWAMRGR